MAHAIFRTARLPKLLKLPVLNYRESYPMKSYSYPANIKKSRDGTYDVQFVDFKEAFTYGDTLDEARDNASEVLSGVLESLIAHNQPIPAPTKKRCHAHPARCQNAGSIGNLLFVKNQQRCQLHGRTRPRDEHIMGSRLAPERSKPLADAETA